MIFKLQYIDNKTNARAGLITTDHGTIKTPIFMPVGTVGTVKGVHLSELKQEKAYGKQSSFICRKLSPFICLCTFV